MGMDGLGCHAVSRACCTQTLKIAGVWRSRWSLSCVIRVLRVHTSIPECRAVPPRGLKVHIRRSGVRFGVLKIFDQQCSCIIRAVESSMPSGKSLFAFVNEIPQKISVGNTKVKSIMCFHCPTHFSWFKKMVIQWKFIICNISARIDALISLSVFFAACSRDALCGGYNTVVVNSL